MDVKKLLRTASPSGACRDLDPKAPYWVTAGTAAGLVIYAITALIPTPLKELIHERGPIQALSVITGGIVMGFIVLKLILLIDEQKKIDLYGNSLDLLSSSVDDISAAEIRADSMTGVLGRRWRTLLGTWTLTKSTAKVTSRLDTDTEAFDLAQQNSYALPRILVWAIPILGFIGTVVGIGAAVSQFDTFLSNAEDIDVLRDGLAKVTGGLGVAFDTTFLALAISLLVMLPLAAVERLEQRLLTRIDLLLRDSLLTVLPDAAASSGAGVNESQLIHAVNNVFDQRLPNAAALVEPAKVYAEKAAATITEHLDPIRNLATDSADAIYAAKQSVVDQADSIKSSLLAGAERIDLSVQSLHPLLEQLSKTAELSSQLDHELKQLQSGARLAETLTELKGMLMAVDKTLVAASRPRRVILTEQADIQSSGE
jgi:hypothetical protein